MTITIQGIEYPLATTLRVAYEIQNLNNHAPYSKVFENVGTMGIEEQIDLLYAAFKVGNPQDTRKITKEVFRNEFLDDYKLADLMDMIQQLIEGIMGKPLEEFEEKEEPKPSGKTKIKKYSSTEKN